MRFYSLFSSSLLAILLSSPATGVFAQIPPAEIQEDQRTSTLRENQSGNHKRDTSRRPKDRGIRKRHILQEQGNRCKIF